MSLRTFLTCFLFLVASGTGVLAEQPTRGSSSLDLPGGAKISAERVRSTEEGQTFEGNVVVTFEGGRFQADRVTLRQRRHAEAEGNVLMVWGENRIGGRRMTYDLDADIGLIEDAIGQVEPEFRFTAAEVHKLGRDRLDLKKATITSCTQPVPYWAFQVSTAKVKLDGYAKLWNLRFKINGGSVVYLPYMVWPVKKDRSFGLLFPNFGTTRTRGRVVSLPLFIPLGKSADLTLLSEYYTEAGFGGGANLRFVPNRRGQGRFNGFFIDDDQRGTVRWRANFEQTQEFANGFRMVTDITEVSDFDIFTDFERSLSLVSTSQTRARVEFSRNGRFSSINVRELRAEQLVSGGTLVQQTLPEIEWRGRNRQLGKSPVYLTWESSFASIQQRGSTIDADYFRADLFPTLSVPISRVPWLDVTPQLSYRLSLYSQTRNPLTGSIQDDSLLRGVAGAGIEIVGPKFQRIFGKPGERQFKHTVEPRLLYGFREAFERQDEVISFDEVDLIAARNAMTYGLRTRLLTKRPRARATGPAGEGAAILMPDGRVFQGGEESDGDEEPDTTAPAEVLKAKPPPASEPVEIATFEVQQTRSFKDDLNRIDRDGDGVFEETSRASNLTLTGRYNPSRQVSFDVRATYHTLYDRFQDASLSGNVRRQAYNLRFSLVHREGLLFGSEDDTDLQFLTGFRMAGGRVRVNLEGAWTPTPGPEESRFPNRRVILEYYTQCCGILAEYFEREFSAETSRQEFRFAVDLRGIGKLLDINHGYDR